MADILETLCTITYDPELHCVISKWNGYASSNQFRAICERMLEMLQQYDAKKSLSDNREMSIISAPDQEWILRDFMPRLLETGYYASGTILPVNHFAKVSLDEIVSKIDEKEVKIKYFSKLIDAKEWIGKI